MDCRRRAVRLRGWSISVVRKRSVCPMSRALEQKIALLGTLHRMLDSTQRLKSVSCDSLHEKG
jgi:hypothetical protein